ncbi:hypothetical protein LINPERHAP2_LOCUS41997 [Linum perenne]
MKGALVQSALTLPP